MGEIRRQFEFKDAVLGMVRSFFKLVEESEEDDDLTFVGVHVRRQDYKQYMWHKHRTKLLR